MSRLAKLTIKELRESLRDRRTIATLLLMPLLVYPLLGIVFQKLLVAQLAPESNEPLRVLAETEQLGRQVDLWLRDGREVLLANGGARNQAFGASSAGESRPAPFANEASAEPEIEILTPEDGEPVTEAYATRLVSNGAIEVAVLYDKSAELPPRASRDSTRLRVLHAPEASLPRRAFAAFFARLRAFNEHALLARVRRTDPTAGVSVAWNLQETGGSETAGFYLASLIPLILILMTATGAVYPAIDLTAGELERGTLEMLAAAPAPPRLILWAKYVAVCTVALLTATANLLAMWLTIWSLELEHLVVGPRGLTLAVVLQLLALLMLFAAFFSGCLLAVTSQTRSFKEAQALLIPLMLVAMTPGVMSMMPGLRLSPATAWIPLMNLVLLSRDLLQAEPFPAALGLIAAGSTLVYAFLALALAARSFASDAFLAGAGDSSSARSEDGAESSTAAIDRSTAVPSAGDATLVMLVLLATLILAGSLPSRLRDLPLIARLGLSSALTAFIFLAIPTAWARFRQYSLRETFRWRRPSAGVCFGAALMGFGLWPLVYELELLTLPLSALERLKGAFAGIQSELAAIPLPVKWLALAATPAICEEWFFRGYLLSGVRRRASNWRSILVTALAFGAFHVFVRDSLTVERFLPSALLGVALGWLALKSNSLWPGVICHVVNNATLLAIAHYSGELQAWGLGAEEQQHLPRWMIFASLAVSAVGVGVATRSTLAEQWEQAAAHSAEKAANDAEAFDAE